MHFIYKKVINFIKLIVTPYTKKSLDDHILYEMLETYKNNLNKQIIVAKIKNTPRGIFVLSASDLVLKRKDILKHFSVNDIVNIVALAASEKTPLLIERHFLPYKYYTLIAMLFGSILIISNIFSSKLINFIGYTMTGGQLIFPLSYVFDDILTEVYGYKRARQLIWGSIACCLVFIIFVNLTILAPPSPYWHLQTQYAEIMGQIPRVLISSIIGYFFGEFLNSYMIAKLKIIHQGEYLWKRIILSSFFSTLCSVSIFCILAFYGKIPLEVIAGLYFRIIVFSLIYEFLAFPFTYYLILFLKEKESVDIYDHDTNFTPFSMDVEYNESNNKRNFSAMTTFSDG